MTKKKSHPQSRELEQEYQGYYAGGQGFEFGQNPYFQSQSNPFMYGANLNTPYNTQVQMQNHSNLGLAYDLIDEVDVIVVEIPFPSLVPESLDITQNTRWIRIIGRTESPFIDSERTDRRYIVNQIPRGIFEQIIHLPVDVIPDQSAARFHNGVLRIELAKAVTSQNNRVSVSFK